jgi:signal transduction histidine kinase
MEIRDLNINLELKVRERTAELADANSTLLKEIEERKQAEEKQKKAKDEADKANKAKSEFLSRMSHELRTPMNSILGFAQLMAMSELTTKQKKSVDHIRNSGKHLLDLINEVLDIAKIESGRLVLSLQPVQLKGAILEIMEILHPNAAKLNQTLVLQNSASNEQSVIADLQRLRQILINIIINAIKYNREGESVVIRTELKTENESVRVSVSDSGQGIKPEYLDKLFQPFERMGAENTTIEGTGLGLPIVKKLVDAMKGSIGVDSRPGEGSTFWFELPVAQNQASQNSHSGDLLKTEPAESSIIGTILYIEDNLSNIELVEDIILTYRPDIRVISTTYGKTAVQFVIENSPDLIFLDLDLPDIHGSEVLFNLLENAGTKAVPTIIISADAMPQQISRLMEAGAKEYLTKPLDIQAFLNVVDEWMGKE